MTARRPDGKATAAAIRADVKQSSEKCSVSRCHVATEKRAPHVRWADVVAADLCAATGWRAPMPGSVGPTTRALLLTNVVEVAERAARRM